MKCVIVGNVPLRTEIVNNKRSKQFPAGSYIAALTAARLGHEVTLITKMSPTFPKIWLNKMKKEKINLIIQPSWQNTIYETTYGKGDIKKTKVISDAGPILQVPEMECDIAIISSYYGEIGINVLKTLKKENNFLVVDVQNFIKYRNPDGSVAYTPWLNKEEYLKYVDLIKLNAGELFYLTGNSTFHTTEELLKLGPKIVALTVKNEGVYYFMRKNHFKFPWLPIKRKFRAGFGETYDTTFAIAFKETNDVNYAGYLAVSAAASTLEKNAALGAFKRKDIEKRCKMLREIFLA
jgi:sugar/nucleoside kinase (ribokinase family)